MFLFLLPLQPLDTDHGRCYQFNGPEYVRRQGARRTTSHNRKSGLRAVLNITQDDYGIFEDISAGMRVSSHSRLTAVG